ncbi:uncharacterized protein LOC103492687 isoform X1 [Cucumis melo]|uniref:Uncharacterized protein LOC103492687 isoform X1 n=1 Tax=Cucumis melo TaxID=3656 RepID=A0ABM3KY36_CUCME|nr:uncharacterized protein LOC103492687 isoform X1 [Cucumis melo]
MARKPVKYFVVDAFTDTAFKGNPAAICLLEEERDEKWLKNLAAEFNICLTCYLIPINEDEEEEEEEDDHSISPPKFSLRWFNPEAEIELCGHATLAAAHVLFSTGLVNSNIIEFSTLSEILTAKKFPDHVNLLEVNSNVISNGESQDSYFIELDFPVFSTVELDSAVVVSSISKALNVASIVDIKMCNMNPNRLLDPVCGSAHCALPVFWAKKLGKSDFVAYMASPRSGVLHVHLDDQKQRVLLRGKAIIMAEGIVLV